MIDIKKQKTAKDGVSKSLRSYLNWLLNEGTEKKEIIVLQSNIYANIKSRHFIKCLDNAYNAGCF